MSIPTTGYGWMVWDHDNERWIPSTFFERRQQAEIWIENLRVKSKGASFNYEAFPVTVTPRPGSRTLREAEI